MSKNKKNKVVFIKILRESGYRLTSQRLRIIEEFLKENGHVNAEELYNKLRAKKPKVGYATVYRTLKLMNKYEIAKGVEFGDGTIRYEPEKEHHDHLICTKCGSVIEFVSPNIELDQERISAQYQFLPLNHRLEIYGICQNCRLKKDYNASAKEEFSK